MAIITFADIAPWVKKTVEQLQADPLAQKVIDRASLLVNDAAGQNWTLDYGGDEARKPPEIAVQIAEALAARVFSNPRVVQQRSVGPMSERLADVVLTGMTLREDEIERLAEFRPAETEDKGNAVWISSTMAPDEVEDYIIPYEDAYTGVRSTLIYPMGYLPRSPRG